MDNHDILRQLSERFEEVMKTRLVASLLSFNRKESSGSSAYREALARLLNDVPGYLAHLVQRAPAGSILRLERLLNSNSISQYASALIAIALTPHYTPHLVIDEMVKGVDSPFDQKLLGEVKWLSSEKNYTSIPLPVTDKPAREKLWKSFSRDIGKGQRIFDYGCGTGGLVSAASRAGIEAYGGDLYGGSLWCQAICAELRIRDDDSLLEQAASPENFRRLLSRVAVIPAIPQSTECFPGAPYHAITSVGVLEHIDNEETMRAVLETIVSLLVPGGFALLNHNPSPWGYDSHYKRPMLAMLLHHLPGSLRDQIWPGLIGQPRVTRLWSLSDLRKLLPAKACVVAGKPIVRYPAENERGAYAFTKRFLPSLTSLQLIVRIAE